MADALIENHLNRNTGISAREHCREWFLLFHGVLLKNRKVLLVCGNTVCREASIAVHQFLERSIGAEFALCQNWMRGSDFHTRSRYQAGECASHSHLQESSSGRILVREAGFLAAVGRAGLPLSDPLGVARHCLFGIEGSSHEWEASFALIWYGLQWRLLSCRNPHVVGSCDVCVRHLG